MIRFQRSGKTKPGKFLDGIRFAKEIAEYCNATYAPISVQVYAELFGNVDTIHWHIDYKDLTTIEGVNTKLLTDQGYWAIVNKGMEFFVEGSFHDCLISSV